MSRRSGGSVQPLKEIEAAVIGDFKTWDHVKLTAPDGSAYITQRLFIYATCGGVAEESDSLSLA